MLQVTGGSRLVLHTSGGPLTLHALSQVPLLPGWSIPVLALVSQPWTEDVLRGELQVPTASGSATFPAYLATQDGVLVLRPGTDALLSEQRRDAVRAAVHLPIRAAQESELSNPGLAPVCFQGTTLTISGGGISALRENATTTSTPLPEGHQRWYAELELPGDRLVPVLLDVVDRSESVLRARFAEIVERDREALIRLVFEQQRKDLAAARLSRAVLDSDSADSQ